MRRSRTFARPGGGARTLSACRSYFARNTSASVKSFRSLTFRRRFPARPRRGWASWLANSACFKAVDTAFGRVGTLVCWDQWYPEGARLTALQGAEVLFYPTAIGWHPAEKTEFGAAQYDAWQTIQRSHAIANGVYVAGVNRVGVEHGDILGNRAEGPGLEFWGGSFLADPFGRVIAKASHDAEEILIGEIDLGLIEETRRNWPFLRDRRIDAYGGITSRYLDPATAWPRDGEAK